MVAAVLGRWLGQSREGGGFCLPHTASRKISLTNTKSVNHNGK